MQHRNMKEENYGFQFSQHSGNKTDSAVVQIWTKFAYTQNGSELCDSLFLISVNLCRCCILSVFFLNFHCLYNQCQSVLPNQHMRSYCSKQNNFNVLY